MLKIRNIETGVEYESEPSDKNGNYEILDIEEGRYILGVSTEKGNFNFEFELFIKAKEKGKLNLALEPGVIGAALAKKSKAFFPIWIGLATIALGGATVGIVLGEDKKLVTGTTRKK